MVVYSFNRKNVSERMTFERRANMSEMEMKEEKEVGEE